MDDADLEQRIANARWRAYSRDATEGDWRELADLEALRQSVDNDNDNEPADAPQEGADAEPTPAVAAAPGKDEPSSSTPARSPIGRRVVPIVLAAVLGLVVGSVLGPAVGNAIGGSDRPDVDDMPIAIALRYGELYDHYRDTLRPCLVDQGYELPPAPGFDEFLDRLEYAPWDPFSEATADIEAGTTEYARLEYACPRYPDTWWDTDTVPALTLFTLPKSDIERPTALHDTGELIIGDARQLWAQDGDELWGILGVGREVGGLGEALLCLAYIGPDQDVGGMNCAQLDEFTERGVWFITTMPDGTAVECSWSPTGHAQITITRGSHVTVGTNAGDLP